jgi:hypothetical protein
MNYQLVQQLQEKGIPAQRSCRVLEASRAGYYGALERGKERKKLCTLTGCRSKAYLQPQGVAMVAGDYAVNSTNKAC